MTPSFGLTFDYRCPFARNGHEAVIARCETAPTSTSGSCRSRSTRSTSRRASRRSGNATRASGAPARPRCSTASRCATRSPTKFLDAHVALFAQRHDHGLKLAHEDVLEEAIASVGLDADAVAAEVWSGRPLEDARGGAHRSGRALGRSSGSRPSRRRRSRVHPLHGPRPRRRPRSARSTCSTGPASTSSSARTVAALTRRPPPRSLSACGCRRARRSCGRSRRTPRSAPTSATSRSSTGCRSRPAPRQGRAGARRRIPRLAERVVSPPLRIAPPEWRRPDARPRLPPPPRRGPRARLDARPARRRRDRSPRRRSTGRGRCGSSRSIEGLAGGRAALLQRVHHTITDGVGGMKLSLSLVDFEREPARPTVHDTCARSPTRRRPERRDDMLDDPVDRDSPIDVLRDAIGDRGRADVDLASQRRRRSRVRVSTRPPTARPGARARSAPRARCGARCSSPTAPTPRCSRTRSLGRRYDVLAVDLDPLAPRPARRSAAASTTSSSPASPARSAAYHRELGTRSETCAWRCR